MRLIESASTRWDDRVRDRFPMSAAALQKPMLEQPYGAAGLYALRECSGSHAAGIEHGRGDGKGLATGIGRREVVPAAPIIITGFGPGVSSISNGQAIRHKHMRNGLFRAISVIMRDLRYFGATRNEPTPPEVHCAVKTPSAKLPTRGLRGVRKKPGSFCAKSQ
jgi:hypothetical protein